MRDFNRKRPLSQRPVAAIPCPSDRRHDAPNLTSAERRRVDLAALQILEAEHLRRLAEIRRDRGALLAQLNAAG